MLRNRLSWKYVHIARKCSNTDNNFRSLNVKNASFGTGFRSFENIGQAFAALRQVLSPLKIKGCGFASSVFVKFYLLLAMKYKIF